MNAPTSGIEQMLNKVPQLTIYFWPSPDCHDDLRLAGNASLRGWPPEINRSAPRFVVSGLYP